MEHVIKLRSVCKHFNNKSIIKNISLSVPKRSVYGFLGNNGAGKSTTVKLLLGLVHADSGEINIFGKPLRQQLPQVLNKIGCIIDTPSLYEHLTAKEYLSIGQSLKGLAKTEINRVLEIVNLTDTYQQVIATFSLGMKQRLAIANALLGSPQLLILDEPTNGLDPQGMSDIRVLLKTLPEKMGGSVFVSSHLLDEVEKIASHVAIIKQGEIILESELSSIVGENGSLTLNVKQLPQANKLLLNSGFQITTNKDKQLLINNIKQAQCPDLHRLLISENIDLLSSTFTKPSLEKSFMQINNTGLTS
ncbi:MAG: ATP-binding cassette domain-containing protein [Colwellia sp.]|nr:ATP-binding cassette domain-containing protein [Colwellia sp.]